MEIKIKVNYFHNKSTFFALLFLGQFLLFVKCKNSNSLKLIAAVGSNVSLPCILHNVNDSVDVVLWFKEDQEEALYTLDARFTNSVEKGKHISTDESFKRRAYLDITNTTNALFIRNLTLEDSGQYRCRVDFRKDKTKNVLINLDVTDGPKQVIIKDVYGQKLNDNFCSDFYNENGHLTLICETEICKPSINLFWYQNDILIDDSFEITDNGCIRNELTILSLKREHLLNNFTCIAFNFNITKRTSSSVLLELNLRPLTVKITGPKNAVSTGSKIILDCKSDGARPDAVISWWFRNEDLEENNYLNENNHLLENEIKYSLYKNAKDHYLSSSLIKPNSSFKLEFIVDKFHNGKKIVCRADHPILPDSFLEDIFTLNVSYIPKVSLTLGSNSIRETINEKSNVTFVCHVISNPKPSSIQWFFNDQTFENSKINMDNVLLLNNNAELILKEVDKKFSGFYSCLAINSEGETLSEKVELNVLHSPVCLNEKQKKFSLTVSETVNISCFTSANPQPQTFYWTFESLVLPKPINLFSFKNDFKSNISNSVLRYTVRTLHNYGKVKCYAKNSIGRQKKPCIFNIVPGKIPERLNDCFSSNINLKSFKIECKPGDDGGLEQKFHLEIYRSGTGKLVKKLNQTLKPTFEVDGLTQSTAFVLIIYSSNSKGKSDSTTFITSTMPFPNKKLVLFTPLIIILLGIIGFLVFSAIIIVLIARFKIQKKTKSEKDTDQTENCSFKGSLNSNSINILNEQSLSIDCNLGDNFISTNNSSLNDLLNSINFMKTDEDFLFPKIKL